MVNLANYDDTWGGFVGSIPTGTDRSFTASAYDAGDNLIYEGTATGVTIVSGETASVYIRLDDMIPADPYENVAPVIDALSLSTASIEPEGTISLAVTAHDENPEDTLTYQWSATGGSFDNATLEFPVWTAPLTLDTYTLTITVTDSHGSTATMSVDVVVETGVSQAIVNTEFNTFPVVSDVSADLTGIDVNESTNLNVIASDVDMDSLTYIWSSDCGGNFDDNTLQTPVFTAPSSYPADNKCVLTVAVDDGRGGNNSGSLTVHIRTPSEANLAPVILSTFQSTTECLKQESVTFSVEAADPEMQPLTFTWSASGGSLGTPVSTVYTSTTSTVDFSASAADDYTITVRIEDGGVLYKEYTFNLAVVTRVTESIITPSTSASNAFFGHSVSISGNRMIVGEDVNDTNGGAAYIFEKDPVSGAWSETAKLVASDAENDDHFGYSVSLDGDRAIVGAFYDRTNGYNTGSAYVFDRDPGTGVWNETAKLVASDGAGQDFFGWSVSLDGNTILVGAPGDDYSDLYTEYISSGAAYVFERDPGTGNWNQVRKLISTTASSLDYLGRSVSISGDYLIVGADESDGAGYYSAGVAYIFKRDSGSGIWSQMQKLLASDLRGDDEFGNQVLIDGDRIVVSSPSKDGIGTNSGAVYVFDKDYDTGFWNETTKITASDANAYDQFGSSITLEGNRIAVGTIDGDSPTITNSGAVYVFDKDSVTGIWNEIRKINASDAESDAEYGRVSMEGNTLIVGSRAKDAGGITDSGAVYIYELNL